jgi:hypothetical protein
MTRPTTDGGNCSPRRRRRLSRAAVLRTVVLLVLAPAHAFFPSLSRLPVVSSLLRQQDFWGVYTDHQPYGEAGESDDSYPASSTLLSPLVNPSAPRVRIAPVTARFRPKLPATTSPSVWYRFRTNVASTVEAAAAQLSRPSEERRQEKKEDRTTPRPLPESPPEPPPSPVEAGTICRVVALSDGNIPTTSLPSRLVNSETQILRKLDDIYHSMSHEETRRLRYMDRPDDEGIAYCDDAEEAKLVSVVRSSLEDAGFELLSRRDVDLCDSLNAGYLLRLSIVPDVSELDPDLSREFYPAWFDANGTLTSVAPDELLYEGKVLVYWRGYSQEVTKGRLVLPKLDYLQATLVQSAAVALKQRLDAGQDVLTATLRRGTRAALAGIVSTTRLVVDGLPVPHVALFFRRKLRDWRPPKKSDPVRGPSFFQLNRYGGTQNRFLGTPNPSDALQPFLISERDTDEHCSVEGMYAAMEALAVSSPEEATPSTSVTPNGILSPANGETSTGGEVVSNDDDLVTVNGSSATQHLDHTMDAVDLSRQDEEFYDCLNHSDLRCPYDQDSPTLPPMQLLRRVSMNNVVDLFSALGRKKLISSLFAKTELVEPTYKEVVVIWRPKNVEHKKPRFQPPQFVYDVADLFDIEGLEPPQPPPEPKPLPLQIRTFDGTPLANLPAVFPKTKLVFRPADAFVFDAISVATLLLAVGSQRFDSPRLDLIAFLSVSLWLIRLTIRYSNKLARYDLLVKTFLTSKISHRNAGALKYLAAEAGSQRATRAALVHDWLCTLSGQDWDVDRIVEEGPDLINELVAEKQVDLDTRAALNDLEDLKLVKIDDKGHVIVLSEASSVEKRLRQAWNDIFRGGLSLKVLTGRR